MTSRTPTFKRIVLAGLLCASAGLGLAQPAPAAGPASPGPPAEAMGRHDPAKMQARREQDRKSKRLNSSHVSESPMPSSARKKKINKLLTYSMD